MSPHGTPDPQAAGPSTAELLLDRPDDLSLTDRLLEPLRRPHYLSPLIITAGGMVVFFAALFYTFLTGIGVWGNNIPNGWAYGITNFVFWIGIGHAGTFISAFLFLLEQQWRSAINRLAEAMTLFALFCAAIFPVAHLGRPWFFYWLIPYPSTMHVWPQFRSSLTWDVAAISTYITVSLVFWYLGLIPDLATARDRAPTLLRTRIYGVLALGWRGSAKEWRIYRAAYALLAGLATPLVVSVHSLVSLDFAIAKTPGWQSTIFPPFFVAGALLSGFAVVLLLIIPIRKLFGLESVITERHLDLNAKMLLLTSSIVGYAYFCEHFIAWYSREEQEVTLMNRMLPFGPYAVLFWMTVVCNALLPQLFWSARVRRSKAALVLISAGVVAGMWAERFVIIAGSLSRSFIPSEWSDFVPTAIDWALLLGSISTFAFLFLLFLRALPFVPIAELKELRRELVQHEERP